MPQRYDCVVYNGSSELDDDENWLGEFYAPLVEVARTIALANSKREAAARAWVRTVGRTRVHKLHELDAPTAIVEHEGDPQQIANELTTRNLWVGECFKLANGVEVWYVSVNPAQRRTEAYDDGQRRPDQ